MKAPISPVKRDHNWGFIPQPDYATLARILRTTRRMTAEEKADIRSQLEALRPKQNKTQSLATQPAV